VKVKAETFEAGEPGKAMGRFESLLGKLVNVPKSEIKAKRKQVTPHSKRERKAQLDWDRDANDRRLVTLGQ
jgi:hypothetical protein